MPNCTDLPHKARHQLMWHRVGAVKLMKWHLAVRRPAVKELVVANPEMTITQALSGDDNRRQITCIGQTATRKSADA